MNYLAIKFFPTTYFLNNGGKVKLFFSKNSLYTVLFLLYNFDYLVRGRCLGM